MIYAPQKLAVRGEDDLEDDELLTDEDEGDEEEEFSDAEE